jgi:hypothetical protein
MYQCRFRLQTYFVAAEVAEVALKAPQKYSAILA